VPETRSDSPFSAEPVEEIALEGAPLVRVVGQVRFPRLAVFQTSNPISPFVERAAGDYPLLNEKKEMQLLAGPSGLIQQPSEIRTWEMRSADEEWHVVINEAFLALTTSSYVSRDDFTARFDILMKAFFEAFNPPFSERLGIRYTNRLSGPDVLEHLPAFFKAEVLAGLAIPTAGKATVRLSISDTIFEVDSRALQVRWGLVPPNASIDLEIPALAEPSWILDLDSFNANKIKFSPPALTSEIRELAAQAYGMFHWIVTDHFFDHYRAAP
jgi:uncharacterized protein (TIGR04255 family)